MILENGGLADHAGGGNRAQLMDNLAIGPVNPICHV